MRVGLDATNLGSGGGITHLAELMMNFPKEEFHEINEIIIFGSDKILNEIPSNDNIKIDKISHPYLNRGIIFRMLYQFFLFDSIIKNKCDILFSLTGDYIGSFRPYIGLSQNMLLYERRNWYEMYDPREVLRFLFISIKQNICFSKAGGVIFLSHFAKRVITDSVGLFKHPKKVIHHGISSIFFQTPKAVKNIQSYSKENPFRFLYVSTIHTYKHQWNVIEAIDILRKKGYPVQLNLVGGIIFKPAGKKLFKTIQRIDPYSKFIHYKGHVSSVDIVQHYNEADGIIFASTCENMPITLLEGMASGIPILCSNKQPMPEFLKNYGFYFNPYNTESLIKSAEDFLNNPDIRSVNATRAYENVKKYSWKKTSKLTFEFILKLYKKEESRN